MSKRIIIRGQRKEFDPERYAHLVIALAKELARESEESSSRLQSPPVGEDANSDEC